MDNSYFKSNKADFDGAIDNTNEHPFHIASLINLFFRFIFDILLVSNNVFK